MSIKIVCYIYVYLKHEYDRKGVVNIMKDWTEIGMLCLFRLPSLLLHLSRHYQIMSSIHVDLLITVFVTVNVAYLMFLANESEIRYYNFGSLSSILFGFIRIN